MPYAPTPRTHHPARGQALSPSQGEERGPCAGVARATTRAIVDSWKSSRSVGGESGSSAARAVAAAAGAVAGAGAAAASVASAGVGAGAASTSAAAAAGGGGGVAPPRCASACAASVSGPEAPLPSALAPPPAGGGVCASAAAGSSSAASEPEAASPPPPAGGISSSLAGVGAASGGAAAAGNAGRLRLQRPVWPFRREQRAFLGHWSPATRGASAARPPPPPGGGRRAAAPAPEPSAPSAPAARCCCARAPPPPRAPPRPSPSESEPFSAKRRSWKMSASCRSSVVTRDQMLGGPRGRCAPAPACSRSASMRRSRRPTPGCLKA
jgi:hypothetical protein